MAAYDARNQDLRHDAPRRDPGRGGVLLHGGQGPDRPAPRQARGPLHRGGLAGQQSQRFALLQARPGRGVQVGEDQRLRLDAAARCSAPGGHEYPVPRRGGAPGGHHLRQVVGLPRDLGAQHDARGKPRDDRRFRRLPLEALRGGDLRRRALLRRLQEEPRLRHPDAPGGGGRGRALPGPVRYEWREPAPRDRRDHPRGQADREGRHAARHPRPQ